jgi:asparagine synthase (glutamine-hydrolysing)
MLAVDRATALVDEMLAKVDVASMAHSVEARVPLLADDVVAAAKALPPTEKRAGNMGKTILRRWLAELSSAGVASRRKTGFNSPLSAWLDGEAKDALHDFALRGATVFGVKLPSELSARSRFGLAVLGAWIENLPESSSSAPETVPTWPDATLTARSSNG